jgi:Protein of unknown function (DUF1524)
MPPGSRRSTVATRDTRPISIATATASRAKADRRYTMTTWGRFRRRRWWWQTAVWALLPPVPVAMWAASRSRQGRGLAWGLAALVTGAWLSVGWAGQARESAETAAAKVVRPTTTVSTTPAAPNTAIPSTTPVPTTAPSKAPPPATALPGEPRISSASFVDQLRVAPEASDAGYDRDLFNHWTDADFDGCDTRCEVLEVERRTDLSSVPGGGWLSIYDGYSTPDATDLEIDHVVALAEAWRSGANTWDPARREAFANDLDAPGALVAVTASSNRSKSDRDPASWQPPNREAWCEFARGWVTTKVRWALTADQAEVDTLRNMLGGCPVS